MPSQRYPVPRRDLPQKAPAAKILKGTNPHLTPLVWAVRAVIAVGSIPKYLGTRFFLPHVTVVVQKPAKLLKSKAVDLGQKFLGSRLFKGFIQLPSIRAKRVTATEYPAKYLGSRIFKGFIQKPAKTTKVAAVALPQKYLGSRIFKGFIQIPAIKVQRGVVAADLPKKYLTSRAFLPNVVVTVTVTPAIKAIKVIAVGLPQKYLGSRTFVKGFIQLPAIKIVKSIVSVDLPKKYLGSRLLLPPAVIIVPVPAIKATKVVAVSNAQKYLGSRLFQGFIQRPSVKTLKALVAAGYLQKILPSRILKGFIQKPGVQVLKAVAAINVPSKYLGSRVVRVPAVIIIPPSGEAIIILNIGSNLRLDLTDNPVIKIEV